METREKIQNTLDPLNKGCLCKTGGKTMKYSCKKRGREVVLDMSAGIVQI